VWVAYIDESAEDERKYLTMAAVLCDETAIPELAAAMDEIAQRANATWGVPTDAEFHTTEMISRDGKWSGLPDVSAAISVVNEVLDAICGIDSIDIVARGVDVEKQRARGYPVLWEPRRVGMQHVLEYCNKVMRQRGRLMVVADEMSKPADHRNLLRLYRREGTPGFRHSTLETILDNIYFMPSHYARGLQAADIVANVHRRWHLLDASTDPRSAAATEAMWAKLYDHRKVRAYGCWPA
jgi:hypothetical protein